MVKGTTTQTVDVTISVPRELWYSVGENVNRKELRQEYGAKACGGNNAEEEWLLRTCLLPYLAREAGLDPEDGELQITPTGDVEVARPRSEDGTFEGGSE